MGKFTERFNGHEHEVEAFWVPDLEMWCVPSDSKYIAYLWDDAEFKTNFDAVDENE